MGHSHSIKIMRFHPFPPRADIIPLTQHLGMILESYLGYGWLEENGFEQNNAKDLGLFRIRSLNARIDENMGSVNR